MYTKIFSFYFIYILEKNGVDTKFIPTEYDDVTIYEYPPELEYMDLKLKKFFRDNPVDVWDDLRYYSGEDIEQKLDEIYQEFAYSCYRISNINFFGNLKADDVIDRSKIYKQWLKYIDDFEEEKKKFLKMKICKSFNQIFK